MRGKTSSLQENNNLKIKQVFVFIAANLEFVYAARGTNGIIPETVQQANGINDKIQKKNKKVQTELT